ncbi:MAG: SatD family protein, partial [archaeon]|nr:SatD family protein [archaeon]
MVLTSRDRYVVLTGDLKSSRKLSERAYVQEQLKGALKTVNEIFDGAIAAKFIVVGGDGFQGMLSSVEGVFDVYYTLFEEVGYPFYVGIGTGSISTGMSENVAEMDGEAFHRSSGALSDIKKKKNWVAFESGREIDTVITASWNLMANTIWNWSKRQKEIVLYYREHGEGREAVRSASANFGVGERSIY